jgi:hypothetical protein
MLRKQVKERFANILRGHKLTLYSFELNFGSSSESLLHAKYLLNPSFFFEFSSTEPNQETHFWVARCPGTDLLTRERLHYETLDEVVSAFQEWLLFVEVEDNVPDDLDSDIQKLKEQFFKELGKRIKEEDSFFTQEEAEDLTKRVDELERKLTELLQTHDQNAAALETVKKKIKEAKKDITTMPKRKWKFIGGGKILDAILAIAKSREGRKLISGGVSKLLGE